MAKMTRCALADGIWLTHVPAEQFKTSVLSIQFLVPLSREHATEQALLPNVLKRGSKQYNSMQKITNRLDELYGGELFATVCRFGETQAFGLLTQVTADQFTLDGAPVAVPALELLCDLMFNPLTQGDSFSPAFVDSERINHAETIRGELNDKRSYASKQLLRTMCANEPYGINPKGELDALERITPLSLYQRYQALLHTAPIEIFYCGGTSLEEIQHAAARVVSSLAAREVSSLTAPTIGTAPNEVNRFVERLDVGQGKLGIGLRAPSSDWAAMTLMNGMFGGTVTSKLFLHVREELSLCYYASSQYDRQKQIITVASGVDFSNFDTAEKAILEQLDLLRHGKWESWELDGARAALLGAYRSYADSQISLEQFWMAQAVSGNGQSPEELAQAVEQVTADQISIAANAVQLDTIYQLAGLEG